MVGGCCPALPLDPEGIREGRDLRDPGPFCACALPPKWVRGAHLRLAGVRRANLEGADLSLANLEGADLRGGNLRGAKGLSQPQIQSAIGDETTALPEDLIRPSSWEPD